MNAASTVIMLVTCGLAIVFNLLVLMVFARTPQLRIKFYAFVFNLVLADIALPTFALISEYHYSNIIGAMIGTSFFAAGLNIVAVAVNRLLALSITPPARYDAIVTRGRLVLTCLLIWVISGLVYFPTMNVSSLVFSRLVRTLISLAILTVTCVLYLVIFCKIAKYKTSLPSATETSFSEEETTNRVRQIRHLMVTFLVILLTSFVCWIPFCVGNLLVYSKGEVTPGLATYLPYSYAIGVLNSAINPFIYWWRIGEARKGLYQLLSCRLCERKKAQTESAYTNTLEESAM